MLDFVNTSCLLLFAGDCCALQDALLCLAEDLPHIRSLHHSWQKPPWSLLGWKDPDREGCRLCSDLEWCLFGNSLPSPHALCIPQHRQNADLNDRA